MELRKKFTSVLATSAVLIGMTAGATMAQPADTDEAITPLNVTCSETAEVDVNVYGQFEVDITQPAGPLGYNATLPGGFEVVLDLTCNWSTDFEVTAEIGDFTHDGSYPLMPGQADSFPGGHMSWIRDSVVYTGPDIYLETGAPSVDLFAFVLTDEQDVISNNYDVILLWGWLPIGLEPIASPGVTTAVWTGNLLFLPDNLGQGQYTAPLTVTLTVN